MTDFAHGDFSLEDLNAAVRNDPERCVRESETIFSDRIERAADRANGCRILCLSGPSGSGKTTAAKKLAAALSAKNHPTVVVSMDDFYRNRDEIPVIDGKRNFEVIDALDLELLRKNVSELLKNGSAKLPRYSFESGLRTDNSVPVELHENGCLIVEGIHGLNRRVADLFPNEKTFCVYISPHSGFENRNGIGIDKRQLRLIRRLIRDRHHRATAPIETLDFWQDVCAAEDLYVRPTARFADFRIDSTHFCEICVFRDEADALLREIPCDSKYFMMTENLRYALSQFESIDENLLPKDSLLREFTKN